jgi:hypothetical protein
MNKPAARAPGGNVAGEHRRALAAMVHNWPIMAARGGLAVVFGLALLVGAEATLATVVALVAPLRAPRDLVGTLALWGITTGVVEIVYAARFPRTTAASWFLLAAGASSVFLAGLMLTLPYADAAGVVFALAALAVARGALLDHARASARAPR